MFSIVAYNTWCQNSNPSCIYFAAVTNVLECVEGNAPAGSLYVVIAACAEAVKCTTHVAVNLECCLENASFQLDFPVMLMITDQ